MSELLTAASDARLFKGVTLTLVEQWRLRCSYDRAFSVAAARAWNMLPIELKPTHVTLTFKRNKNTFFMIIPI
jgi:hypothetical protein